MFVLNTLYSTMYLQSQYVELSNQCLFSRLVVTGIQLQRFQRVPSNKDSTLQLIFLTLLIVLEQYHDRMHAFHNMPHARKVCMYALFNVVIQ